MNQYVWKVVRFGKESFPPEVVANGETIEQASAVAKTYLEKGETLGKMIGRSTIPPGYRTLGSGCQ